MNYLVMVFNCHFILNLILFDIGSKKKMIMIVEESENGNEIELEDYRTVTYNSYKVAES